MPTPDIAQFVGVDSWNGGAQTIVVRMKVAHELLADLSDEELANLLGPIAARAARAETWTDGH